MVYISIHPAIARGILNANLKTSQSIFVQMGQFTIQDTTDAREVLQPDVRDPIQHSVQEFLTDITRIMLLAAKYSVYV